MRRGTVLRVLPRRAAAANPSYSRGYCWWAASAPPMALVDLGDTPPAGKRLGLSDGETAAATGAGGAPARRLLWAPRGASDAIAELEAASDVREWLGRALPSAFGPGAAGGGGPVMMSEALRSGVLLCELANALRPGTVPRVSRAAAPFPQRENIAAFVAAARSAASQQSGAIGAINAGGHSMFFDGLCNANVRCPPPGSPHQPAPSACLVESGVSRPPPPAAESSACQTTAISRSRTFTTGGISARCPGAAGRAGGRGEWGTVRF